MSSQTWECTRCGAQATMDVEARPVQYNTYYPVESGPYSNHPPAPHHCPIRDGLVPPQIEEAQNARRVK